ncbi:MAG: Dps family protein [Pseudomonadales bacterium]|jgi:starvation-inducible DNA-binding protein|nr:Dps family protein [Pseudomonadales bacterium]
MSQPALKTKITEAKLENGLKEKERGQVAEQLSTALSYTYRLFVMTQGVHWNVQGPLFYSVHKLTEEQYTDMFEAIDDIAERIRALGFPAPQTLSQLIGEAELEEPEVKGDLLSQIRTLVEGHERTARLLRDGVEQAEKMGDVKSADLMTDRIGLHEEHAWMLRATIAS